MNSRKLLLLLLLFLSKFALAQKFELVNSGDIINRSIQLADSGLFKNALALLDKVNRSDTNYVTVLLRKGLICNADSQYNEAIKHCKEALALKANYEAEYDIYNLYGSVLLDMGNYDEAIKVLDTAMKIYPEHATLYFNKGIAYLKKDKLDLAEQWFQRTLLINPYVYSAHYYLGLVALLQGKIVPAYLSYMSYLIFAPKGKFAGTSINVLQQITVNTDEVVELKTDRKIYPNSNYQDVEDVISSKIALNKAYKINTTLDDPISRQIQAVIEKLEYSAEDPDFWAQYYLPFLKKVYAEKKFDLLITHMFSNVSIPAIVASAEKNKKQIAAFISDAGAYFDQIRFTRELMWKKRDTIAQRYFYDGGVVLGKGTLSKDGKSLVGNWNAYYGGGNIKGKGLYNTAGQRTGAWIWYYSTGALKAKEIYLNGKLEGQQEYYFLNGNRSSLENYVNGQLNGTSTIYYFGGAVKSVSNYKAGKLDGEEKNYYGSGDLALIKNYTAGELNGPEKGYYRNGKLKTVSQYVNGKADRNYKQYNTQGILTVDGNFVKDQLEGEWKYYTDEGKLRRVAQRRAGLENGVHKDFYATGELSSTYNVVKDKIDGELLEYYRDGKILTTQTYQNGSLVKASYLDRAGKQLSTMVNNGETSSLISYGSNGFKKTSLNYTKSGILNGADTVFYNSGKVSQIGNYKDGVLDGKLITYYQNGTIKSEATMANDETNGYYTSFYMNGKVESEGWIVEGQNQGPWFYYTELGKLSSTQYYLDGELDGFKEEYFPTGQKSVQYKYYQGWLEEVANYDEQGKVLATDVFHKGEGKFRLLHPDGKLMAETNLKNGEFEGVFKSYYFDGSAERVFYYKNGLLDSTYTSYQHGGLKLMEGRYTNGEKIGEWKFYDEDGKLMRVANYKGDKLNGAYNTFHPNGNKKSVSEVKDDLYQGAAKIYDLNGALAYQISYTDDLAISYTYNDNNGKLIAEIDVNSASPAMKSFFNNGKPSRVSSYLGGERHGDSRSYYENGNLSSEEHFEYGILEGPAKTYYENGKVKTDFTYLNDQEHGLCKSYNENGTLKKEANYEHGTIQGPVKLYNENGKLLRTKFYEHGVLKSVKNG